MNISLAVLLIAVIWVILIAALVIWYLIARARRKREAASPPGPLRHGAAGGRVGATGSGVAPTAGAADPSHENLPLGPDLTQPIERLPQRPPSSPVGPEPFGLTTQQEYERLAAEPFQAPPATALGEQSNSARFSWAEASQSGSKRPTAATGTNPTVDLAETPVEPVQSPTDNARPPAQQTQTPAGEPAQQPVPVEKLQAKTPPAAASQKATGITNQPVASQDDDLDRTVVVSRDAATQLDFTWSLVLPDGDALPLGPDSVVGRRPSATEGSTPIVIADPTRTLSKSHARLRFDGERWWVIDLGSTNGLWLLHPGGLEEEVQPYEEVEAPTRLRLGTLEVELHEAGQTG